MTITTGQKKRILYSLVSLSASNYRLHTPSFFLASHVPRTCILAFAISSNSMHDTLRLPLSVFWTIWSSLRQGFWAQSSAVLHLGSVAALMGLGLLHFAFRLKGLGS